MSTIYTQHTVKALYVTQTDHRHQRAAGPEEDETPTALDCAMCEPYLVKEGWVYDPALVPLTDRQERERERIKEEGNAAVSRAAEALAATALAASQMGTGGVTQKRTRRAARTAAATE